MNADEILKFAKYFAKKMEEGNTHCPNCNSLVDPSELRLGVSGSERYENLVIENDTPVDEYGLDASGKMPPHYTKHLEQVCTKCAAPCTNCGVIFDKFWLIPYNGISGRLYCGPCLTNNEFDS